MTLNFINLFIRSFQINVKESRTIETSKRPSSEPTTPHRAISMAVSQCLSNTSSY